MKAKGSKGPEALKPWDAVSGMTAGNALAAALCNDWTQAKAILAGLSEDELETLGSVALRFGEKARDLSWTVRFGKRRADWATREQAPNQTFAPCGRHLLDQMWLTKNYVCCPCGSMSNRTVFPKLSEAVEAINPTVHCQRWQPEDDRTKHHGAACNAKRERNKILLSQMQAELDQIVNPPE